LLAGEAYANLGKVDRAIDRLEYVKKNGLVTLAIAVQSNRPRYSANP